MPDLSEYSVEELKSRLPPHGGAVGEAKEVVSGAKKDLSSIPTNELKSRLGGAATDAVKTGKGAIGDFKTNVLGQEPDIDYQTGAPWMVRVNIEKADNPNEVKKTLSQFYKPEDFGQDKGGRWWVREGGKKVSVGGSGFVNALENMAVGLHAASTPTAGAILGGSIGAGGGPFGVALGAGLGAAGGRGIDEVIKYFQGRSDKTAEEEVSKLSTEAAVNMATAGAAPILRQLGPAVKQKIFGVTPTTAATSERLLEKGAIPPIGSAAPEATGFEMKRRLRNVVSYGKSIPPADKKNIAYVDKEIEGILRSAGIQGSKIADAVEEIKSGTSAISRTEAGESIVSAAKRRVESLQSVANAAKERAQSILSAHERNLRGFAGQDVGRLGQDVAQAITSARQQFGKEMGAAYKAVHAMTGDRPVVDLSPAIDEARSILGLMPKGSVPQLIGNLLGRNDAMATIEEAHNLRSSLRQAAQMSNLPNLTPEQTYALYARVEGAVDDAFGNLAKSGTGLSSEAAKLLKSTDATYREGIAKFKDATLNKLVRDVRSGLIPDPEVVANTVLRQGNIERSREILRMVPPEVKKAIGIADSRAMLAKASTLNEQGKTVVNGKALLQQLEERSQVLSMLHDPKDLAFMKKFATEMAAMDGEIEISALHGGGDVVGALRKWSMANQIVEGFARNNPAAALRSGSPRAVDRALSVISSPGKEAATEAVMKSLTPTERRQVHVYNLKQLFASAMEETPAKTRSISGEKIHNYLAKLTEKQQDLLFPYGMASDLRNLGKDIRFLFPSKDLETGASMAAVSVTSKGFFNPFGLRKRIGWFVSGWLTDRPQVLSWFAQLHEKDPSTARQVMGAFGRWLINSEMAGPSGGKPQ